MTFSKIVDLSIGIIPNAPHEPWKPSVRYLTHDGEGLEWIKSTFGAKPEDLVWSGGLGAAFEEVRCRQTPWDYRVLRAARDDP